MSCARSSIAVRVRPAITLAVLLTCTLATTGSAETRRMAVRVYEAGAGDPVLRAKAVQTASALVELAGISVEWYDCTENGRRPECQDARRAGNYIARIMPALAPGTVPRRGPVEALNNPADTDRPLGFAVVDPGSQGGKMATVFHDQIDAVSRRTGVARSELLGRALAHEVGHLLLGVRGHSRSGLMRAVWTDEELTRDRAEDWLFAPADSKRLQQLLIEP
jgi:hypothetical protein